MVDTVDIDIGPTITPSDWAATFMDFPGSGPELKAIFEAAQKCVQPNADIKECAGNLKKAVDSLDFFHLSPAGTAGSIFLDECNKFLQQARKHVLFNDSIEIPLVLLTKALGSLCDSLSPASTINLLDKVFYIWPTIINEEFRHYNAQLFDDGRPINTVLKYKSKKEAVDGAAFYEATLIEREAPKPYLYILMRNDLGSLNSGKAVAQGSHAANQMIFEAVIHSDPLAMVLEPERAENLVRMVSIWSQEAHGFGTCIVLGATEKQMRASVASAKEAGIHAGITHDPSYPVKDGESFYTVPLDTCAYIFDYQVVVKPHVSELNLMP